MVGLRPEDNPSLDRLDSQEPTNSPTMAPSTLKTIAMSSPANTNGSALGNVT